MADLSSAFRYNQWIRPVVCKDGTESDTGQRKTGDLLLPELPFKPKDLSNVLSTKQIDVHYNQHHKKYVIKTQELARGTEFTDMTLRDVVLKASGDLLNNAAQSWNHAFYWMSISPPGLDVSPKGSLLEAIRSSEYKDVEGLGKRIVEVGSSVVGSGWVWLVCDKDFNLNVVATRDAGCPIRDGMLPILCLDVWEHAYYLDYESDRKGYLNKSVQMLFNWTFAGKNWDTYHGRHE